MRKVVLYYTTEVLCPVSGITTTYHRMSDYWCQLMRDIGYIVTNTEEEYEV